jgi:hypothetical protein
MNFWLKDEIIIFQLPLFGLFLNQIPQTHQKFTRLINFNSSSPILLMLTQINYLSANAHATV